jgi:hypothetical protein
MDAKLVSLAGMQMKTGVDVMEFEGIVTHVYGYAASKEAHARGEYLRQTVVVKPDDGGPEVEVDQTHIIHVGA